MPKTTKLSKKQIAAFQKTVHTYYQTNKRSFPWRETTEPYKILVSEIMLQQTQTERVIKFYNNFLKKFPTIKRLAQAELGEVIKTWQGLGYNRRAKALHECAKEIMMKHNRRFPQKTDELTELPGIGPYTAAAIQAFAFNIPAVVIETNVRTAYIHHFFHDKDKISDDELLPLIRQTIDKQNPRQWYNALMDYGTMLKQKYGNLSRKSKHYAKQSKFEGSDRQIRGKIIKLLTKKERISEKELLENIKRSRKRVKHILNQLIKENLIKKEDNNYST